MTWFLEDEAAAAPLPLATRRQTGWLERYQAGITAGRIEDNSWDQALRVEEAYIATVEQELAAYRGPDFERTGRNARPAFGADTAEYGMVPPPAAISPAARRPAVISLMARAKKDDPKKWAHLPDTPEAFTAHVNSLRQAEYDEATAILNAAPGDAFGGAEFLGRAWAGLTDPVSLATLPLGGPIGKGAWGFAKFVGIEALLGGASELAIADQRQNVSDDLDVPEPNLLADIGIAALTAGVFAGGLGAIGHGVNRLLQYRAERGTGTAVGRDPDVSPSLHEGAIRDAGQRLEGEVAPAKAPRQPDGHVAWEAFDFTPAGNASPKANRVGYVYGRLIEKGMPPHIAAGFVGNLMVESRASIDPHAVGDGGSAIGIAQWNDRRPALIEFARKRGKDWQDLDTQIDFILHELETTEGRAKEQIWATTTPQDAALAVSRYYERSGIPHNERRVGFARSIFDQASGGQVPKYEGLALGAANYGPASAPGFTPTSRGYTGDGQISAGDLRIDVEYVVVDASLLRKAEGRFQPRDRSRIASDAWISDTAARLDPAQLMPSPTADRGTPIVGPDNMIESGNGRFAALQRAYDQHPDRAAAYRQQIKAAGFDVPEGIERPVLIARRRTELDDAAREQLTVDAQDSGVARMTPTEIAQTSARAMTADRLATYRPGAKIGDAENQTFLQSVLGALPRSERNAFFDEGGALNAEGRRRMNGAFFARAWDNGGPIGRDVLGRYAEAEDAGELKGLMDALEQAAPAWATLRAEIEAGNVRPEFDITPHVLDALSVIMQARREAGRAGGSIADAIDAMLAQGDLFAGPNPLSIALLRKFWRDGRSAPPTEIARFLTRYADEARTAGRAGDMLGASPADVLRAIDSKAFADLPDDIPPLAPPPARPTEVPDLPEAAFAKGADSPEAEAADAVAMDELRAQTENQGPFGPVLSGLTDQPEAAIERLMATKGGEVPDAIVHPTLGKIAFVYGMPGEKGYGLVHIQEKHGDAVLADLPDAIRRGTPSEPKNGRVYIDTPDSPVRRTVVKLEWENQAKAWVVTSHNRYPKGETRQGRTTDVPPASEPTTVPDPTGRAQDTTITPADQGPSLQERLAMDRGKPRKPLPVSADRQRVIDILDRGETVSTRLEGMTAQTAKWLREEYAAGHLARETDHMMNGVQRFKRITPGLDARWQIATDDARAEFADLADFKLPNGATAADLLDDLDADKTLSAVIDACTLGGKNT